LEGAVHLQCRREAGGPGDLRRAQVRLGAARRADGADPAAPTGVVTHASSDLRTVSDPDIIAAMRFIQENAERPIDVADVALLSRRTLQSRFRRTLGRTALHEIEHARLERAKQMRASARGAATRRRSGRTSTRPPGSTTRATWG
jgi:transcriptional regulator GlxA family with amidase domain